MFLNHSKKQPSKNPLNFMQSIEEEEEEYSRRDDSFFGKFDPRSALESVAESSIDSIDKSTYSTTKTASCLIDKSGLSPESEEFKSLKRKMNTMLWEAVERNDIEEIKKLIDVNRNGNLCADTNSPGLNNWSSLHMAAAYGLKEACEVLIYNGKETNINSRTSMNRTPLHLATIHNHINVVKLLIHEGAIIDLVDNDVNTPLHYASTQGYSEMVDWLLKKNPKLDIKNHRERTPADIALNYETFSVFSEHCNRLKIEIPVTGYSRSIVHHTLMHNSREDQINKLLNKAMKKPNLVDLKLFSDRPKPQISKQNKKFNNFSKIILPPSKVGPYDFRGLLQIGKGSFGEVYLVEKMDTLEQYALKVLRKEKVLGNNLVRYAFTERNILMSISHPFIVKLNFAFQTPEKLVMVMDFCPNGDLGTQLAREKHFSEEKAKFYLIEVLLALQELHRHGIIFRDLKPENVVLDRDGHARLTDFGLSKEGIGDGQLAKSFCGSVAYLAPEMLRKSGHSRSVDWYLLGVLLYEMLVGAPPYYSSNREQLFNNIQRGKLKIPSTISGEAKNLIKNLLQRDPGKRLGASKRDAEDVKIDSFFKGVDWNAYLSKMVKPPDFHPIKRVLKEVTLEKMFGKLEEDSPAPRLEGWSVLQPS
jgi:Protein kinase domain/Ankyrin repeats (3 copies)